MFSIHKKIENGFHKVILNDDLSQTSAEIIPSCSAMLHSFNVNQNGEMVNVIQSFSSYDDFKNNVAEKGFMGCKLSPFAGRVHLGRYEFGEKKLTLQKHYYLKHAMHGELFDKSFELINKQADNEKASITLKYSYQKEDPGYPFSYDCIITWTLEKDQQLSVTTECINKDEGLIPLQDSWHPYFTLGEKVDDLLLEFQSMELIETDAEQIPTKKLSEYDVFNSLRKMGNTHFDDCFTLNMNTCQPLVVLKSVEQKIQIEIYPSSSYPYLQLYTPDDRKSIAIENMSGAPDAFNNKMGLQILEPNQTAIFQVKYRVRILE
ncbi:MAG: aldose 1-epimerase [Ginsengibacter sp.]|jgi:aldose 1-epimerase